MEEINNGFTRILWSDLTEDEKLKTALAGYKCCSIWFACKKDCTTTLLTDEEVKPIYEIMNKYNLSLKDFLSLYVTYWKKAFQPYCGEYGPFFTELESQFLKFRAPETNSNFSCHSRFSRTVSFSEYDPIAERNILKLLKKNNTDVNEFQKKYNLSDLDFIILAKTKLYNAFTYQTLFGSSDQIVPDLGITLENGLGIETVKSLGQKTK